jgi:hypothetical protein
VHFDVKNRLEERIPARAGYEALEKSTAGRKHGRRYQVTKNINNKKLLYLLRLFAAGIDDVGFRHPADLAVPEADLYATGMKGCGREDVFDDTIGEPAVSLVLFKNNGYFEAGVDVFSVLAVHVS